MVSIIRHQQSEPFRYQMVILHLPFKGDKPLLGQGVESKSPEDKYNWDVAQELKDILLDRRCFVYKNILIKGELR